ncbi:hypothetical protein [Streptomyces sp. NPDC057250]|uniref:hypothetical protein n=1 Tax=Streptomyces sp. NPDC057250 TaxID=3346068 RepID=UPI003640AA9D
MSDLIHVRPALERRRAFAQWATVQTPKLRTLAPDTFGVPADLYADVPEVLLIGSLVDGHRYVSPDEDEAEQPAGTLVGEHGPEVYLPLQRTEFTPLEDAPPEDEEGPQTPAEDALAGYACPECERPYATERGLAAHRRQKHSEGA